MTWEAKPSVYEMVAFVEAIDRFHEELPGWWLSFGECSVSCHASCGPDIAGADAYLLAAKEFDEGFHADIDRPSTLADAIHNVRRQARAAVIRHLEATAC